MSHLKERAEKICLNCNAQLTGPFCHICGQENIEPKETAWHLVTHFFNDITHFDGKFFSTIGLLIRRPGFLPREYMLGRRARYLNPVRMYIFTSAIFFLIFFSIFHITDKSIYESVQMDMNGKTLNELRLLDRDSLRIFTAKNNHGKSIPREGLEQYFDSIKNNVGLDLTSEGYTSKQEYDAVLKNGIKKHNWLHRKFIYREIEINEKYHHNLGQYLTAFFSAFIHSFPQILFISLPLFALFLKLLYRRQKDYYYVSHGIFSIHLYIFLFITMLLMIGLGELRDLLHWEWLKYLRLLLGLSVFFYLYKAMRNFYQQRRAITIVKFLLLSILSFLMIGILCFVFILFSLMKI